MTADPTAIDVGALLNRLEAAEADLAVALEDVQELGKAMDWHAERADTAELDLAAALERERALREKFSELKRYTSLVREQREQWYQRAMQAERPLAPRAGTEE